jgi:hypothetical protein
MTVKTMGFGDLFESPSSAPAVRPAEMLERFYGLAGKFRATKVNAAETKLADGDESQQDCCSAASSSNNQRS